MSILPKPISIKDIVYQPSSYAHKNEAQYSQDFINLLSKKFKSEYEQSNQNTITKLKENLLNEHYWNTPIEKYLGFTDNYGKLESLTVSIDEKVLVIREAYDRDGNIIKWKTFGSKKYIPYKIKGDFVLVLYGMAEILLAESMELDYICFQSDSIAMSLTRNEQYLDLLNAVKDKSLLLVLDNDDSCKKTVESLKTYLHTALEVIPIDLQKIWKDRELPKGYDFRDLCNEMALMSFTLEDSKNTVLSIIADEYKEVNHECI